MRRGVIQQFDNGVQGGLRRSGLLRCDGANGFEHCYVDRASVEEKRTENLLDMSLVGGVEKRCSVRRFGELDLDAIVWFIPLAWQVFHAFKMVTGRAM